jgi:meso-butanediol dehydrogenase / (S,S)-butanediol dehydrogenase / diacetyl reductase
MYLTGQVALVTGGGTGIGAAVVRSFVAEGASVLATGRRAEPLEAIANETGAVAVRGDIADESHIKEAVETAVERFGGLDIVVNNAGIGWADWQQTLDANLTGAKLISDEALPHLVERRGSIVNVASVSGYVASAGTPAYSVSKAGLIMLTRSLALNYGPRGVRVNAVCPGWVRTPMGDASMDEIAEQQGVDREGAYELAARFVPLRRAGEPDEIAAACLFLASRQASFITGASLVVDGGAMVVDITTAPFET